MSAHQRVDAMKKASDDRKKTTAANQRAADQRRTAATKKTADAKHDQVNLYCFRRRLMLIIVVKLCW
jgi:hypothetical protein